MVSEQQVGEFLRMTFKTLQAVKQEQKTVGFSPSSLMLTNYFIAC